MYPVIHCVLTLGAVFGWIAGFSLLMIYIADHTEGVRGKREEQGR